MQSLPDTSQTRLLELVTCNFPFAHERVPTSCTPSPCPYTQLPDLVCPARPRTAKMSLPSIGDILMLSQLAWKIGRAFTAGRKGAPAEFLDVETAINGLAKALKLLAETLFAEADDSVLAKADSETKSGVATILLSCQRTLQDLDSLMDQYQVIKKHRTSGGFTIERSWSDLVLSNYQSMMWTTEGGDVQTLRNMVNMHASTIALTMQALQR